MAKKATRRAWTADHVRTLKTLAKKKTRAASIAKTLKRTEGATRRSRRGVGWNWGGVVSGVFNLESPGVEAPGWRPRHERRYHAFNDCAA